MDGTRAWPSGGGEMGERLRAFGWPTIGWSTPDGWPRALRTVVDIMLGSRQPMFVAWGPQRRMLYNDQYAAILAGRHPAALGRPFEEVWYDILQDVGPIMDQAYAGQSTHMDDLLLVMHRRGYPEETHFTFSYTPVRDDSGAIGGVFCACSETTGRVLADRRIRFQYELNERLRGLSDPAEVAVAAAGLLGRRLGVSRVGYAEVKGDDEQMVIEREWTDAAPLLAGRRPLAALAGPILDILRSGEMVVVDDCADDPRCAGGVRDAFDRVEARAALAVPLVKDGRLTAILFVLDRNPRVWTEADAALAPEVAERTWAAVERARAETALRESEARFRAMADSAPSPVWMTEAGGGIAFVNQAFAKYAGRPSEALLGDVWLSLIHPEDVAGVGRIRAEARVGPDPYTFEARFRRGDGEWRMLRASSNPRFDGAGVFQGYVGIAVDLTDTHRAEAALRESEARFRRVAEDAPVMLWMTEPPGKAVYQNRALRAFWDLGDDASGFDWTTAVLPEDRPALFAAAEAARRDRTPIRVEARYRNAEGEVRTLLTRAEPRLDAEGRLIGMIGVNVDVTEARRAEARQRLLMNELNHRVKNTLATVQSVARQTLRSGASPAQAAATLESRLLALSAAHDVLTRENWESALLHEVAAGAVAPYQDPETRVFEIDGPPLRVAPRTALSLAMALHELVTNAAKYGALTRPEGRARISWTATPDGRAALEWRETGGPPAAAPTRRGFGSRLIEQGLARELGAAATLEFTPAGVVCRMSAAQLRAADDRPRITVGP